MVKKALKRAGIAAAIIFGALLLAVIAYVLYFILNYYRVPDNVDLTINGEAASVAAVGTEYVAVTQNIGFGAYTTDFTFFMDGGKESRAKSRESVISSVAKAIDTVKSLNPDFVLFQEVDLNATRSYHVDQYAMICRDFPGYSSCYAQNYDSPYIMYPIFSPHGAAKSSLATFSNITLSSSLRRSLPISDSFSKFLDLDRCYSVSRIAVENGKELLLYNIHSSAYGGSEEIRNAQMSMLLTDMAGEYAKGNYVVCGGDFNHDFAGDSAERLGDEDHSSFGWAQPFPDHLIPEGFSKCIDYKDGELLPTCRNCDIPYEEGNFVIIVDGFIISDNVECIEVENIQTGFEYSDHTPVKLTFKLK